ncbi:YkgJ family cysteine cluster protein [Candidatus Woesearchaeota archaeon]|nr:YkgJ family cysteine cluster protein [Candidatus Woesearchaeota archaeon]
MSFKCQRCGYCCTIIARVSLIDMLRLKKQGYNLLEVIQKDHTKHNCLKRKSDGDCIFLERHGNKTNCKIYEHRPKVCRKYPGYKHEIPCKKANPSVREYLMRI